MCDSLCSVSWGKGNTSCCTVPFPTSSCEGTCLLPLCLSQFPQLGLEGRAGEECGLFFLKVRHVKLFWLQPQKVCCFWRASSMFLFVPNLRVVILAAAAPWQPHGSELWFHSAHRCLLPCLGPLFAVFIPVLFPEMGRGSFPNHHEDDFGDEWSCVNCKKHAGVSSTAICVFSKASVCCSGVLAALAQLIACLVNFLLQLLKVCSLLLHWWCY